MARLDQSLGAQDGHRLPNGRDARAVLLGDGGLGREAVARRGRRTASAPGDRRRCGGTSGCGSTRRRPFIHSLSSRGRRPHDLRHTAASLWIAAGVDIKTVSAWLGHSTAKLTLDTYGHLMGTDADRAALERVNRALGYRTGTAEGDASRV